MKMEFSIIFCLAMAFTFVEAQETISRPSICSYSAASFINDVYDKTLCYVKIKATNYRARKYCLSKKMQLYKYSSSSSSIFKDFARNALGKSSKAVVSIEGVRGKDCLIFNGAAKFSYDRCSRTRHFLCEFKDISAPSSRDEQVIQNGFQDAFKTILSGGNLDESKAAMGELFGGYGVPQEIVDAYFDVWADLGAVLTNNPTDAQKEAIRQNIDSYVVANTNLIESIAGLENLNTNLLFLADPRFAEFNVMRAKFTIGTNVAKIFPEGVLKWFQEPEGIANVAKTMALALEASRVLSTG